MADTYKYFSSTGLIVPDTTDLQKTVEGEYRNAFGQDLIVTPESPEGVLIAVETEARDSVIRNNAEVANQINPAYAGGIFLDAIAALTGLERRKAEPSLVTATLTGTPGAIIPPGTRAATTGDDIFKSRTEIVLNAEGWATADFISEVADAIPAPVGSLTKIVDLALGWETITNTKPAVLGQPIESDARFRKRREDTLFLQGVALPGAILSSVLDTPGVRSAVFRENYDAVEKIIDGVSIPPHSIYVVVDGGTDEDVARSLFENKSLGCGWKGNVEVNVTCPVSGQVYLVRFDRPELIPIRARLTVRVLGTVTADTQTIVRTAIMDYADDKLEGLRGFRVGASVSPFELAVSVGLAEPSIFVISAAIGAFDASVDELTAQTLPLKIWQKATITQGSVDVVTG